MKVNSKKEKCKKCNNMAVWCYVSGDEESYYCEAHVPRGCSCNSIPIDDNWENSDPINWHQETDEDGKEFPCCEYIHDKKGWEKDEKDNKEENFEDPKLYECS